MTFKRKLLACFAICIMAVLVTALCGCEDLGAFESTEDYYASFGEVVFLGGDAGNGKAYSVDEFFYNKESKENFLTDENGVYTGVKHSDYVYIAIPLEKDLKMDSLAMYLQATNDVTVYINVYVTNKIPSNWKTVDKLDAEASGASFEYKSGEESTELIDGESGKVSYDDPNPETRIGEVIINLKDGVWKSFTLNNFKVNNVYENSIQLKDEQYILLQIRNNSGVREFDEEKGLWVDGQTGLALKKADITMTNLLVRALD